MGTNPRKSGTSGRKEGKGKLNRVNSAAERYPVALCRPKR